MFESISQSANQSACREVVLYTNSRNGGINSGDGGRNRSSSSKIITSLECLLCARHHANPLTFQSILLSQRSSLLFALSHSWIVVELGLKPGLSLDPLLLPTHCALQSKMSGFEVRLMQDQILPFPSSVTPLSVLICKNGINKTYFRRLPLASECTYIAHLVPSTYLM